MMDYKQAVERLLKPADSMREERRSHPAVVQMFPSASGKPEQTASYADFQRIVEEACVDLAANGVKGESPVLLCSPNTAELVAATLACWRLGALAIPVDFRLTDGEVNNTAQRVNARVVYAPGRKLDSSLVALDSSQWRSRRSASIPEVAAQPEKPALVILTSGTTGIPKGAVHDFKSLIDNMVELGGVVGLAEDQSVLLPLPFSHIFGLEVTLAALIYGGTLYFADFVPADFAGYISSKKPTVVCGVPTIYGALTSMPVPSTLFADTRMPLCGGAPLPASLANDFERKFNLRITQGYGTTETKIICVNQNGPIESIGRVVPSSKIEIVDGNERVLPDGEIGELRVTGPCLMLGYLNNPDATKTVMHDGHYHTGDIGHIADGYVFISGRSKEMIIVAGNKIFPSEVEDVLRQHPLAAEVAVVGMPHSRLGQIVKAIVVVPPGEFSDRLCEPNAESVKQTREELQSKFRQLASDNLKRELRPMAYEFRPSSEPLPKTHTGKIDKKQLVPA